MARFCLGTLTSLGNSAAYAGVAASLATLLAVTLAARAGRSGRLRHALDIIALGNMAVPGLVLGAAYVIAFNNDWAPLYGMPLLLVIGYVATHAPMLGALPATGFRRASHQPRRCRPGAWARFGQPLATHPCPRC